MERDAGQVDSNNIYHKLDLLGWLLVNRQMRGDGVKNKEASTESKTDLRGMGFDQPCIGHRTDSVFVFVERNRDTVLCKKCGEL